MIYDHDDDDDDDGGAGDRSGDGCCYDDDDDDDDDDDKGKSEVNNIRITCGKLSRKRLANSKHERNITDCIQILAG